MADLIKFQCKACGKKMGVRPEYAGKKARCSGCKQPLRVPTPRPRKARKPQRAATGVPVEMDGASPGGSSLPGESSAISLEELAALEQAAPAHTAEMTARAGAHAATPQVPDGKACPGCGTSVKQEAVICVHCGHSFQSGKRLKTKKDSKIGKALAAATAPDEETEGAPLKTMFTALVFIVFGLATMIWNYDPAGSDPEGAEILVKYVYDNLGQYPTGGLLILVGLFFGGMAFNAWRG